MVSLTPVFRPVCHVLHFESRFNGLLWRRNSTKPLKRLVTGESFRAPGSSQVSMRGGLVRENQFDSRNQKHGRETKGNHADSKMFTP